MDKGKCNDILKDGGCECVCPLCLFVYFISLFEVVGHEDNRSGSRGALVVLVSVDWKLRIPSGQKKKVTTVTI